MSSNTSAEGAAAMAASGTVAVLLPGAFYLLRETVRPLVELFRRHGVPMAVATDANPGTSPLLLLALNMACVLFGPTPEALAGMTRVAARAWALPTAARWCSRCQADLAPGASPSRPVSATGLGQDLLVELVKDGRTVGARTSASARAALTGPPALARAASLA
ncbi:MAG: hypothetical protein U1E17_01620 [Geminicoccaceae bacterium]